MNHPTTSSHAYSNPNLNAGAGAAAWWQGIARRLLRAWTAASIHAERKGRFVPYC